MKLKIQTRKRSSSVAGEEKEYKQMILTFEGYKKTIKLMNEKNVVVVSFVKGTNPEFGIYDISEEGEREFLILDKAWEPGVFEGALGLKCTDERGHSKGECTFDPAVKKIKVGKGTNDEFSELTITNTNDKFELHEDVEDYNQGYRFVFNGTTVSGSDGSPSLDSNGNYEMKWKFENGKLRTVYLIKKNP